VNSAELLRWLALQPFIPFRICFSDGELIEVLHKEDPDSVQDNRNCCSSPNAERSIRTIHDDFTSARRSNRADTRRVKPLEVTRRVLVPSNPPLAISLPDLHVLEVASLAAPAPTHARSDDKEHDAPSRACRPIPPDRS